MAVYAPLLRYNCDERTGRNGLRNLSSYTALGGIGWVYSLSQPLYTCPLGLAVKPPV